MIGLKQTAMVACACIGLAGIQNQATAQVTQVGPGLYKFQPKYVKGAKMVYQMTASTSVVGAPAAAAQMMGGGNQYAVKTTTTLEVLDVKNGIATVRTTSSGMSMNGKSMGKSSSFTSKVKAVGGQPVSGGMSSTFGQTGLPDRPLKVGETFTTKNAVQMPGAPVNVNATSKFLGVKTVNGKQVAQINSTVKMTGRMRGTTTGYSLIDMADGQLISTSMTADMEMSMDGFAPKGTKSPVAGMKPIHMKQTTTITRK